jgi:pimeloyl-ACP methyl ester carboxylesterase
MMDTTAIRYFGFVWLGLSVLLASCSDSDSKGTEESPTGEGGAGGKKSAGAGGSKSSALGPIATAAVESPGSGDCPIVIKDEDCDHNKRPFVFVHGTYGSGDNIGNVALLFGSNGYCQDRFVAVEYNSLGGSPAAELDKLIDSIREKTGADQVELAGHSQGTGHCVAYLQDPAHAAKVAHYINFSGRGTVPNDVKTLSLSSDNDIGGIPNHAPNAEKTVTLEDIDHFGVAASTESFVEVWKYLYEYEPKFTTVQCGDEKITLEGLSESFADNAPVANGKLEVRKLGETARDDGEPLMTLTSDGTNGHVGPVELDRGVAYEFKGIDASGKVVGRMYFGPFKRSNRLVRFLSPSANPLVVATTTGQVKVGADHSALVLRYLAGAFRHDLGNSLKVNGAEVLTDANAGRSTSTVGLFMSDQNMNKKSDLGAAFSAPFIVGTDVFIPSDTAGWIELDWNGTRMKVPNWPSSDGMLSVVIQ